MTDPYDLRSILLNQWLDSMCEGNLAPELRTACIASLYQALLDYQSDKDRIFLCDPVFLLHRFNQHLLEKSFERLEIGSVSSSYLATQLIEGLEQEAKALAHIYDRFMQIITECINTLCDTLSKWPLDKERRTYLQAILKVESITSQPKCLDYFDRIMKRLAIGWPTIDPDSWAIFQKAWEGFSKDPLKADDPNVTKMVEAFSDLMNRIDPFRAGLSDPKIVPLDRSTGKLKQDQHAMNVPLIVLLQTVADETPKIFEKTFVDLCYAEWVIRDHNDVERARYEEVLLTFLKDCFYRNVFQGIKACQNFCLWLREEARLREKLNRSALMDPILLAYRPTLLVEPKDFMASAWFEDWIDRILKQLPILEYHTCMEARRSIIMSYYVLDVFENKEAFFYSPTVSLYAAHLIPAFQCDLQSKVWFGHLLQLMTIGKELSNEAIDEASASLSDFFQEIDCDLAREYQSICHDLIVFFCKVFDKRMIDPTQWHTMIPIEKEDRLLALVHHVITALLKRSDRKEFNLKTACLKLKKGRWHDKQKYDENVAPLSKRQTRKYEAVKNTKFMG